MGVITNHIVAEQQLLSLWVPILKRRKTNKQKNIIYFTYLLYIYTHVSGEVGGIGRRIDEAEEIKELMRQKACK